jgi:hypothetical protein
MAYQHPYVKQVNRCATVAFAPNAPFIATGTMAGAIDLSFSTTACLEVRNSTVPRLAHLRFSRASDAQIARHPTPRSS